MIDLTKIFHNDDVARNTNISELLSALVDPSNTLDERKALWHEWQCHYYNNDDILSFFDGILFNRDDGADYPEVMCKTRDYKNFYELAMSLDMANLDSRAYYLYWILKYSPIRTTAANLLKEAFQYDPDTILSIFPDVREIVFQD